MLLAMKMANPQRAPLLLEHTSRGESGLCGVECISAWGILKLSCFRKPGGERVSCS